MRQNVSFALTLALALGSGCAESHGAGSDSGPVACSDAGWAPFGCVYASPDHTCGDAIAPAVCTAGLWTCPAGTTPEHEAECWCSGRPPGPCECTPSGWRCGDPIDAGPPVLDAGSSTCPPDFGGAEGTPCAPEGMFCGSCGDPCGFCNLLRCEGGVWTRLEAPPPPPPCTSFDCGPELRCQAETQYCEHVLSDVAGVPDDYACRPLEPGCASCECTPFPTACEQEPEGGMTITLGGG